jgi:hypothetical protein
MQILQKFSPGYHDRRKVAPMTRSRTAPLLALALAAGLAAAPAAHADSSLFGAVAFPNGDLADVTTAGWSIGGYLTRDLAPRLDAGLLVAYTDFVVDTTQPGGGAQFGPTLSAWEIEALAQYGLGATVKAFLGLGIGNYSGRDERGDAQRKTAFAWQAGLAYRIEPFELRLAYHYLDAEGGSAGWIGAAAGILF